MECEMKFISEYLKFFFPQFHSITITSSTVCSDEYFFCLSIQFSPKSMPPCTNTIHRKLGSISTDAYIDPSCVLAQIINTIRSNFSFFWINEVIYVNSNWLSLFMILLSTVLEVSNIFLFLAINGYDRKILSEKCCCFLTNEPKLCIPVRMILTRFICFSIRL